VELGDAAHVAVARDLGEHGGGGDGGAAGVAADDRTLLVPEARQREAVDEADRAVAGHPRERGAQGVEIADVEPAGVDRAHAAGDDRHLGRRLHDARVELLARGLGVLLGVVQARERAAVGQGQALEVEEDGGGHERAREAAATGLVGAGDPAHAERAVELEQAAARPALHPRAAVSAVLGLRGGRCGWVASRWRRHRR
jgi:hypothetical protein